MISILEGDCRELLTTLPLNSVHCVVTSPPYYGLRDYQVARQLGLETTPDEYIQTMVAVFREVRRVLRDDGTCWVNMGDSYATSVNGRSAADTKAAGNDDRTFRDKPFSTVGNGYKPKDLMMMPARLALALQADGWWIRSDIIWSKPNPMPESVTDRPTNAHEHVFLLTKSARYYYDAVREESITGDPRRPYTSEGAKQLDGRVEWKSGQKRDGEDFSSRNLRNVWTIATAPFPEAHFATFPPALAERCIKAGTSERGCCAQCGKPWQRNTIAEFIPQQDVGEARGVRGAFDQKPMDASNGWDGVPRGSTQRTTTGWSPGCQCGAATVPCTVLDPFGGAGTTGLVADRLQRDAILIELNPAYCDMARNRISRDAPLLAAAQ